MDIRYDITYSLLNNGMLNTDKAVKTFLESGYEEAPLVFVFRALAKLGDLLISLGNTLKFGKKQISTNYVTG